MSFHLFSCRRAAEISRGPPIPSVTAPLFSRFFLLAQTEPLLLRLEAALPPLPAEPFSRLLPLSGQGLLGSGASSELSRVFLASRRTRFGFSGRTLARSPERQD